MLSSEYPPSPPQLGRQHILNRERERERERVTGGGRKGRERIVIAAFTLDRHKVAVHLFCSYKRSLMFSLPLTDIDQLLITKKNTSCVLKQAACCNVKYQ